MSQFRLINRKNVRELALGVAKQTRAQPFSRISTRFLEECEAHLSAYVRSRVRSAPSVGRTI